ncbi:MAG: coenzyme F420-0:L-glutamate ligase, partial [Oscillospiraceae bacterium]
MSRCVGAVSRGIRIPIIREGDDLVKIVTDSLVDAFNEEHITVNDKDVVGVTESVVARSQANYANCDQIAKDIQNKFKDETVGVIFPILSRNRFSIVLKSIARGAKKIVLMLSYPSDEVGNHLISLDQLDEKGINPYSTLLDEAEYRRLFGKNVHPFTQVDYVEYYKEVVTAENCEIEVIFSNTTTDILKYTKYVLCADIHSRKRSKRILKDACAS